jgi:hypothetical protein
MAAALIAGVIDLALAVFHILFWRLFGWPERLHASGSLNTAITQTMNAMLIYLFAAYGAGLIYLALQSAAQLSGFARAYAVAGTGALVWRTALQFRYFPMRDWRSVVITAVFVIAALLHGVAALQF